MEAMYRRQVLRVAVAGAAVAAGGGTAALAWRLTDGNDGNDAAEGLVPRLSQRLYSDDSPWNTPLPGDVAIHPKSSAFVERLSRAGHFGSDPTQYTYPVYVVDDRTPLQEVRLSGKFSIVASHDEIENLDAPSLRVPIPDKAVGSRGSDQSIVLLNADSGHEWGFWRLERTEGQIAARNGYLYHVAWSGVPPRDPSSRVAGGTFVSRGAGVPYAAGLIRRWEIDAGEVAHALSFAYNYPSPLHVYPATKSDGRGLVTADLPEGSRLQLDPSMNDLEFSLLGLDETGRILARALQRYGMIVIDNSGHPKVMAEDETTAKWGDAGGRELTARTVASIPLDRFRVVDWNEWTGGPLGVSQK
jgi:hypothetical protein